VNGSSPCGEIASFTSRGFGVAATSDTVVNQTSGDLDARENRLLQEAPSPGRVCGRALNALGD
jgi:hypothetical protein